MILKNSLKRFLFRWNWFLRLQKRWNRPQFPSLDHLLELYSEEKKDVFFIQIGAHCLHFTEPLYRYIKLNNWRGILVEPQHLLFKKLEHKFSQNYNLILENVAISNEDTEKPFYFLSPKSKNDTLPEWVNQLSSFHKEVPESVLDRLPEAKIDQLIIKCTSINNLLKEHKIKKLDLLMIDTEGHDFIILSDLNFEQYQPSLILYEHHFLNKDDDQECISLLRQNGYFLYRDGFNTLAFKSLKLQSIYNDFIE